MHLFVKYQPNRESSLEDLNRPDALSNPIDAKSLCRGVTRVARFGLENSSTF